MKIEETPNGMWLSQLVDGVIVSKLYLGRTRKEAKELFLVYIEQVRRKKIHKD